MLKPFLALALVFTACNVEPGPEPKPVPVDPGPVRIVHTGKNLVLYPRESMTESLYIAGTEASEWRVELKNAPSWASYSGGLIWYSIPEGMSGLQEVRAIATRNGAVPMETSWTVTTMPYGNRKPTLTSDEIPAWIVGGATWKLVFHAQDPDGDRLTFSGPTLPMGAVLKDSILEWTPPVGQVVVGQFIIHVTDGRNGIDSKAFSIPTMSFDPAPYAAEPVLGRSWWIRGFHAFAKGSGAADSSRIRRRITVTARDLAANTFSFRVIDTLGNGNSTTSDTVYTASSRAGFGFVSNSSGAGEIPFAWPKQGTTVEDNIFNLEGADYPAKWVDYRYPCPDRNGNPGGSCKGGEKSLSAKGLGLVMLEIEVLSYFSQDRLHDSLAVWAVSGP